MSTLKPSPFQGTGEITVRDILNGPEELYEKGRVFAHTTVARESATMFMTMSLRLIILSAEQGHLTITENWWR